ncbi:MAG: DUF3006 domain-containing protein [Clostridia bacterium]|nr:DUF3006 domain-containing protein [Clostridia bacterium]
MVCYTVERIEGNVAVLTGEGMSIEVDALLLDYGVREGDTVTENGEGVFIKDTEATAELKKEYNMLQGDTAGEK